MDHLVIVLMGISLTASMLLGGRANVSHEVLENGGVCTTIECLQIADDVLNSINESVKPCDNFYDFACGNWELHNPQPAYGLQTDGMDKLSRIARARLRDELENESSREEILPVQQMKDLYKSCMEIDESEMLDSVNAILDQIHGWSMIMESGTWNSSAITWQEIDRYYEELMGLNAFYELDIVNTPSEHGLLQISMKDNTIITHTEVIESIATKLKKQKGLKLDEERLRNEAHELKDFEKRLREVPDITPNIMFQSSSEFINWWNTDTNSSDPQNNLDWEAIFQRLLNIRNFSMTEDMPIYLRNPSQFRELPKILASTDKRVISNFVHAQFVIGLLDNLLFILHEMFHIPRWDSCLNVQEPAVAHLYIRKYYGSHVKAAADEMVRNIQEAFELQITGSNWLPYDLKEAAKQRVRNIKFVLGHEDWYMNETALIDYYKDLTLDDNYLGNILHMKKRQLERTISNWGKPVKFMKWIHSVVKAKAEGSWTFDSIHITAATFQSPLLDQNVPDYFGYGKGAYVIGHEIGHFFENTKFGFYKVGFFDANVKSILTELIQCFIDLFDGYVNGSGLITYRDNLPDWYGLQAALHAYKKVKDEKHPNGEVKLPGLQKYTDLQMFFLSFAQYWCGHGYTWDGMNQHHAHAYRVTGTLSNTKAFAEAFKCPENSPMNPKKKCDMWMKKPDKP